MTIGDIQEVQDTASTSTALAVAEARQSVPDTEYSVQKDEVHQIQLAAEDQESESTSFR
jgi:hypothetical protein